MTKISDWAYPHWYVAAPGPAIGGSGSLYVVRSPGERPTVVVHDGNCRHPGFTPEQLSGCMQRPSGIFASEAELQGWGYRPVYGGWEERLQAARGMQKKLNYGRGYDYVWAVSSAGNGCRDD